MRRGIKTKLDKLWSLAVKAKAGGKCELCFSVGALNSHHIFSRRFMGTRFDVSNGVCLCIGHHFEAHQKSSVFTLKILKKRGDAWHDALQLKSQKITKNLDDKLIEIELKEIIKLEGGR